MTAFGMATKKSDSRRDRRRSLRVLRSSGSRQPFLRGMVTHDLVQRGLSFDDAYAAVRALRDRLADRDEIETSELRELIEEQLAEMFDASQVEALKLPLRPAADLQVSDEEDLARPFSRGLLASSLQAAGVDPDRAYGLVVRLQAQLRRERVELLDHVELARRVGDHLEVEEGTAAAERYRTVRRIRRLSRPLVIYVAGATGTGKSTLAHELAPLLRIYRVSATDTIRQVMRMVFSPAILPGLHRSSFETVAARAGGSIAAAGEDADPILTSFEEQATRVCVGVRAVVDRALAENTSLIVEGAHLLPPLVPFPDLEGGAYQLMVLLTTLEEEIHRSRFVSRSLSTGRRAQHYLENLDSIRVIQEHLLERAERADIPILDTSDSTDVVPRSLRLITGALGQLVPWIGQPVDVRTERRTLLLVIDGLADRPVRALGFRTPLQAARTPTLDRLASEGICGLADPVAEGVVPDTASGSLALLGQSPMALKRGPMEALGAGLDLRPGDVALRANLATLNQDGLIIDRRAGRIRDEAPDLARALDQMSLPAEMDSKLRVRFRASTEHRMALVLQGDHLSPSITGSDPGDGAGVTRPLKPRPLDESDQTAAFTARALSQIEDAASAILQSHPLNEQRRKAGLPPANVVLTRGAGRVHRLNQIESQGKPLEVSLVSGDQTLLGLADWVGARSVVAEGMTANLDTDLELKFHSAHKELECHDLVVIHVKGADIAAHDRRPDLKVEFLERVDRELGRFLERLKSSVQVAVAADHATLSETGQHSADPVPVLIWGPSVEADSVSSFDEVSVASGGLQRFPLQRLVSRLF